MSSFKPNYYTILPAPIRYDKNIPSTAKLLYAEILALSGVGGICSAPNSYFAEAFSLSEVQVSYLINLLAKKKYIEITIKQNYLRQIKVLLPRLKYPIKSNLKEQEKKAISKWTLEDEINKFANSARRDLNIFALWVKLNGFKPQNKEQWDSLLSRNIKIIQKLKGYTDKDISDTFQTLKNTEYIKKITLETITKYIDYTVKTRQNKKPPIKKWVEYINDKGVRIAKPIY